MIEKKCPSCGTIQLWDALFGYQNPYCPDLCKNIFGFLCDLPPKEMEDKND